jgi:predicted GNAT family acetyltransferase
VTLVGYLGTIPVAAAQALVSHDVGGVYWVGAVDDVRGRGIGEAVSRAATNALLDRSARACVLQTSKMAETIYRRLGYVTLYRYRTYLAVRRRRKTVSAG